MEVAPQNGLSVDEIDKVCDRSHPICPPQVTKIEHHRSPVTAVRVCNASDVLVSGSRDATICLWSLDNFELLNLIQLKQPVLNLQISSDSVSASE